MIQTTHQTMQGRVGGKPPRARVVSHLQQPARQHHNQNINKLDVNIDDLADDLVHSHDSSLL